MSTKAIPPKDRSEWEMIVKSEINYSFKNFVLQMKSDEFQRKLKSNDITIDEAVDELYELCLKYAVAVKYDLKQIFKEW